ncbi:chitobiase/beta-hexosaminidase C-terminal domain-containing protein [Geomonas oryzisoli]|uniref:Chitobiase/beta-hexosaminidase C-terminal domain-containing protein n=1 Tax=Geomonas oryzisoli TaxID=2847992 RepID=A0ABX8J4A7_9BACT|nr:LamG-like jellyroll fold domain-containing protein [Geomonas oryzisoli]QWV93274.1 chitobiase/beta-hexosaminidase C-terminal domain-containing protein [Geomonas oryzisoli]
MKTQGNLMVAVSMLLVLASLPVRSVAAMDTTQPTTSVALAGTKGTDGWYSTPVTVTLVGADGADGSGVAKTEYNIDNASWQPYSAPFVIDKDGSSFVQFRSTDLAGNIESPAKGQEIKINKLGLVGLWRMDGTWSDGSVAGNNGSPNNGVAFSTTAKVGTQSGSFDGVDDYVSIPSSATLTPATAVSVEAWVRPADTVTWHQVVTKRYDEQNSPYSSYVLTSNGGGASNKWVFAISNGTVGSGASAVDTEVIVPNAWTHLVGTYDGAAIRLYVNGILKATTAKTGAIGYSTLPLRIGTSNVYAGQFFKGLIDEVRVYNRALTASEVQEQFNNYVVSAPTVMSVASPTAKSVITLGGTKQTNTAIAVNGNILVPLDGTTSWQGSYSLAQGTNTISVTAVDTQKRSSLPVIVNVVSDTTPPQVTATMPARNAVVNAAPASLVVTLADTVSSLNFAATLSGAAVTSASGLQISGTWSTSGSGSSGSIFFTPSVPLREGSYTMTVRPTDVLGNATTYSLPFSVDCTPPAAPVIDPAGAIRLPTKTITGTRTGDSDTIKVLCPDAFVGTISYPTATTWSVNVWGLKDGANYVTAYAYDAAGNASAPATATIIVDTVSPSVSATPAGGIYTSAQNVVLAANEAGIIYYTIDGSTPTTSAATYVEPISIPAGATLKYFAKDLTGNDSEIKSENYIIDNTPPLLTISALSDGALTNNEILNISGTVTDSTGVKEFTVNQLAVQANADGSFSYPLVLRAGPNDVTITATDLAGNKATSTRTVTLDQTAPVLVVKRPADNIKTGVGLLELAGAVDKASTVTVKRRDVVQTAVMNGGDFTATVSLDPGYDTIEVTATDLAGNQSSQKRTVVFDEQVPSLAVTVPNQDVRTNQSSLTIKGTVYDALTAVGVTVTVDGKVLTVPVIDGTFETVVSFSEEKTYSITVTATNEAGTSATVQRNVIYDITPPVLGIDPVVTPTSQLNGTVSGVREADAVVTVACATATVGEVSYPTATTWRAAVSGLAEGENVITAASTDVAGNVVTATTTIAVVTKAPEITVDVTPDVIWPPKKKMVPVKITGGVEAYGSRIASTSVSVSDEYGKIQYKNLTLGSTVMLDAWCNGTDKDGRKYTITVAVTTVGGMTTTQTATVTVLHDKSGKVTTSAPAPQVKTKSASTAPATQAKVKAASSASATPARRP